MDIEPQSYFTLRIPGFFSPRSTAETESFAFSSYNSEGILLDYQYRGLVVRASEYHEIKTLDFQSTSQVIGEEAFLEVTFITGDELFEHD